MKEHITDGTPCWCNPELNFKDPETGETFNTVWVNDGNSILNYSYDEVVNKKHLPKNLKLIRTITE